MAAPLLRYKMFRATNEYRIKVASVNDVFEKKIFFLLFLARKKRKVKRVRRLKIVWPMDDFVQNTYCSSSRIYRHGFLPLF